LEVLDRVELEGALHRVGGFGVRVGRADELEDAVACVTGEVSEGEGSVAGRGILGQEGRLREDYQTHL
jgi:hypothetical protein